MFYILILGIILIIALLIYRTVVVGKNLIEDFRKLKEWKDEHFSNS